jgi:cell division protein FtsW (lipid II flippase)
MHKQYNILASPAIPEIFLAETVLLGEETIKKGLVPAIEEALNKKPRLMEDLPVSKKDIILDTFSRFSPAVVAFAGLADGINPCAFTALIFFVSFLTLYSYSKKKILVAGIGFMLAVFITYLLLGIGGAALLGRMEQFSVFSAIIKYAISSFAFILCALAVYDLVLYKRTGRTEGLKLQLPGFIKSLIHKNITQTYRGSEKSGMNIFYLFAVTFVSGVFIAALESVCTGQIYLPTITFIMTISGLRVRAFMYLLLYNICFMIPLAIIFLLSYKGVTSERFVQFSQRHMAGIKIMYALLFFGLGLSLFIF